MRGYRVGAPKEKRLAAMMQKHARNIACPWALLTQNELRAMCCGFGGYTPGGNSGFRLLISHLYMMRYWTTVSIMGGIDGIVRRLEVIRKVLKNERMTMPTKMVLGMVYKDYCSFLQKLGHKREADEYRAWYIQYEYLKPSNGDY